MKQENLALQQKLTASNQLATEPTKASAAEQRLDRLEEALTELLKERREQKESRNEVEPARPSAGPTAAATAKNEKPADQDTPHGAISVTTDPDFTLSQRDASSTYEKISQRSLSAFGLSPDSEEKGKAVPIIVPRVVRTTANSKVAFGFLKRGSSPGPSGGGPPVDPNKSLQSGSDMLFPRAAGPPPKFTLNEQLDAAADRPADQEANVDRLADQERSAPEGRRRGHYDLFGDWVSSEGESQVAGGPGDGERIMQLLEMQTQTLNALREQADRDREFQQELLREQREQKAIELKYLKEKDMV